MAGLIVADDIEQLRERSDIVEVVSGHLKLRKAGRMYKGLCCFHQEKTPSFTVDPDKQMFHCFGCGVGGDVYTFIRKAENLSFTEAAERLASRVGMTLRFEGGSPEKGKSRQVLLDACKQSADFFESLLNKAPEAGPARKYLEGRGFSPQDASDFKLGFAPHGRDTLYRHLLGKGFKSQQIVDAGLAMVTEDGQHRDRFRGRVIFPVFDLTGNVVGFGARALGDEQPKYLNSPESAVYHKARLLYALDRAKAGIAANGIAVVTEGYTDVMALFKVGIKTAVATCGTALGEEHFVLLKRFCERVVLAFDADAAGVVASERGFGLHERIGLEVLVAPVPAGKDPADVALTEGAEAAQSMIDSAQPLMRFVLEREIERHRLDTPDGKAKAVRAVAGMLALEPNRVARSEHGFWVARRIGVDPQQVQLEIAEYKDSSDRGAAPRVSRLPGHVRAEREALSILMGSPSLLEQSKEWLTEEHFTQSEHIWLLNALKQTTDAYEMRSLMDRLPDEAARSLAAELAMTPLVTTQSEEVFKRLEEFRLQRQISTLRAKLGQLDPQVDVQEYDSIFKQLMQLDEQRRRFDDR